MEFETQTLDIDGVRTVVKVIGDGPPVVALHGAGTLEGLRLGARSGRPLPRLPALPSRFRRERSCPAFRRHAGHDRPQSAPRRGARPRPAAPGRAFHGRLDGGRDGRRRRRTFRPAGAQRTGGPEPSRSSGRRPRRDQPAGTSGLPRAPCRRGAALLSRRLRVPAARAVPRRPRQGRRGAGAASSRCTAWAIPTSAAG